MKTRIALSQPERLGIREDQDRFCQGGEISQAFFILIRKEERQSFGGRVVDRSPLVSMKGGMGIFLSKKKEVLYAAE